MNRSHGKIKPLGFWDAVAVAALTAGIWFLIWVFTGALCELHRYLHGS